MTHVPAGHPSVPDLADSAAAVLVRLRGAAPLVQCLTNQVVSGFTANVLLAVGAAPAMVDIPDESGLFAQAADAVLVNLGTPHAEQREAMTRAVASARESATPWVLDPVAVGSLPVRTTLALALCDQAPAIVRGNASEVMAVGGRGAGGRGVDAADGVQSARPAALALAARTGGAVAVSGPVDLVVGAGRAVRLANGDPMLTRVTGGGCALGALMAACAAVEPDPLVAAATASLVHGIAAEKAAEAGSGPGSFAVALLDALHALRPDEVAELAVVA